MDGRASTERGFAEEPSGEGEARAAIAHLIAAGRAAEGRGDVEAAVRSFQKAALLARSLGDPTLVCELLVDSSVVFSSMREFPMATRFLSEAKELAQARPDESVRGEVYRGFGALFRARGDTQEALVCLDRALQYLEYTPRLRSVCRILLELGEIYLREGKGPKALHFFARAENLGALDEPALEIRLRLDLGRAAILAGDRVRATAAYEEAGRAARASQRPFDLELVQLGLSGLYLQGGRMDKSLAALAEAMALSILAFTGATPEPRERARFLAMGDRLFALDRAWGSAREGIPDRRQIHEAVRLFNTHPLVMTGQAPDYLALAREAESESAEEVRSQPPLISSKAAAANPRNPI